MQCVLVSCQHNSDMLAKSYKFDIRLSCHQRESVLVEIGLPKGTILIERISLIFYFCLEKAQWFSYSCTCILIAFRRSRIFILLRFSVKIYFNRKFLVRLAFIVPFRRETLPVCQLDEIYCFLSLLLRGIMVIVQFYYLQLHPKCTNTLENENAVLTASVRKYLAAIGPDLNLSVQPMCKFIESIWRLLVCFINY